jgi:NADH:ubiquinone reductase (H+-translocating)
VTGRLTGPPLDAKGRVAVDEFLAVEGSGALCAPTAQHAYRQARRLAGNLAAVVRGGALRAYRHASAGSVASLGPHRGVAEV